MTFPPQQQQYPPQPYGAPPAQYAPPQQQYAPPQQAPQQQGATQSAEDFFARRAGGAPSFPFGGVGSMVVGTIVEQEGRQRTEIGENGKLLFFPDGSPQMQLVVTLQTDLRNWEGLAADKIPTVEVNGQKVPKPPQEDDGKRRIYVWFKLRDAFGKALSAVNQTSTQIGDQVAVRVSALLPNPKGKEPIKDYEVRIKPGSSVAAAFFDGQQQAPAAPVAPVQPPAPQQAPYNPQQAYAQGQPAFQQGDYGQPLPPQQAPAAPAPQQAPQQGNPWDAAGQPPF